MYSHQVAVISSLHELTADSYWSLLPISLFASNTICKGSTMSDEKKSGSGAENRTDNTDKGGRRRYFWRKKRTQKTTAETGEPKEPKEQIKNHKQAAPKVVSHEKNEKADRDPRNKRRRRRPRSRQPANGEPKVVAPALPGLRTASAR